MGKILKYFESVFQNYNYSKKVSLKLPILNPLNIGCVWLVFENFMKYYILFYLIF